MFGDSPSRIHFFCTFLCLLNVLILMCTYDCYICQLLPTYGFQTINVRNFFHKKCDNIIFGRNLPFIKREDLFFGIKGPSWFCKCNLLW